MPYRNHHHQKQKISGFRIKMPKVVEQYFLEEFAKLATKPMNPLSMQVSLESGHVCVPHGSLSQLSERPDPSAARQRAALKQDLKSEKSSLLQRYFEEEFAKLVVVTGQSAIPLDRSEFRAVQSAPRLNPSPSRGAAGISKTNGKRASAAHDTVPRDNSYLLWTSEAYIVVDCGDATRVRL
jgi:hypothetical protein